MRIWSGCFFYGTQCEWRWWMSFADTSTYFTVPMRVEGWVCRRSVSVCSVFFFGLRCACSVNVNLLSHRTVFPTVSRCHCGRTQHARSSPTASSTSENRRRQSAAGPAETAATPTWTSCCWSPYTTAKTTAQYTPPTPTRLNCRVKQSYTLATTVHNVLN